MSKPLTFREYLANLNKIAELHPETLDGYVITYYGDELFFEAVDKSPIICYIDDGSCTMRLKEYDNYGGTIATIPPERLNRLNQSEYDSLSKHDKSKFIKMVSLIQLQKD